MKLLMLTFAFLASTELPACAKSETAKTANHKVDAPSSLVSDSPLTNSDWPKMMLQGTAPLFGESETKLIILDFWAVWCDPCQESLPFSSDLQKKYAAQGVRFIGLSTDDSVIEAKEFLGKMKLSFPNAWDQGRALAKKLDVDALPTLVILSNDGKVLHRDVGFTKKSRTEIPEKIDQLLKRSE